MALTPGRCWRSAAICAAVLLGAACAHPLAGPTTGASAEAKAAEFYGTLEPFASEAVYFVVTDRFVNGDPRNDQRTQGGRNRSFDRPTPGAPAGKSDNTGYLGGDFKGIVDNADYLRDLGFGAVWVTPVVDNPDEAFTGGKPVAWGVMFTDRGKSGYHGYWGVNFFELDEHLPSPGLDFAGFTSALRDKGLKVVLDVVTNHGSPAYTMPKEQPKFGKVFDRDGRLIADHQNLPPDKLDPANNTLHRFFNTQGGLAELSDFDEDNPQVLDYFVDAYSHWIDQGAAAFRVDTLTWMPHAFWKQFADRIRARHPGFFMFGEAFDHDAGKIAQHTWPANGGISVLDFPLKSKLIETFEKRGSDYAALAPALHLEDGPYANPYELMTFYDNHDMARMNASDAGFIDAHNWLFTARGIPVIYYGSETGFMRGTAEHAGNRNYYGQARVDAGKGGAIHRNLQRIARLRRDSPALQRGLQLNLRLQGDMASFLRVYEHGGTTQTAWVLLNKGDEPATLAVGDELQSGEWRDAFSGELLRVQGPLDVAVPAHGVRVFFHDRALTRPDLRARLSASMARKSACVLRPTECAGSP